jgi:hypothetical protein
MSRSLVGPDEQFARLLELSSPMAAGADARLAGMASIANALRAAGATTGPAGPDPAFRAALRQRLVAVATVQVPAGSRAAAGGTLAAATDRIRYGARRRVAALAGAVAIATSFAGVGIAAARSLPGDPFYGVKRATEAVQLWTARGNLAKGQRHLEFARTRLAEIQDLSPTSSHIASTIAAMNSDTTTGSQELIAAYKSSHSTEPLHDLLTFSHQQLAGLTALAPTLPANVRPQDLAAIGVVRHVVKTVHTVSSTRCLLCGGHGPGGNGNGKGGPGPTVTPTNSPHPRTSAPGPEQSKPASGHSNPPSSPHRTKTPRSIIPSSPLHLHLHLHKHPLPVSTLLGGLGL